MKKLHKRRIDALKGGHLNDDEVDEGLIVAAISNIEKDRVAAREYAAQKRRKLQIVKKDDHDFSGKTVYVTSDRPPPDGLRQVMNPPCRLHHLLEPGRSPLALKFAACLHGSSICTQDFVHGKGSARVSYFRAAGAKRHVHITDAFLVEQAEFAEVILLA